MPIQTILQMGNPLLLRRSRPVERFDTPELHALVADLWDTMAAARGAGLAAPQIGVDQQVVVFGTGEPLPRYPQAPVVARTVLCNPVITPLDSEQETGWEGCLSVPGLRGRVARSTRVRVQGFDARGGELDFVAEGFHARVVQHECDHLWGVLYPMRMTDLSTLGLESELAAAGLWP